MGSSSTKELRYFGWRLEELGRELIIPEAEQKLALEWHPALTSRPEFRTPPMVWHVPTSSFTEGSLDKPDNQDHTSIPMRYLANVMIAGDEKPARTTLRRHMCGNFFTPYGTTPVASRLSSRRANHDRA